MLNIWQYFQSIRLKILTTVTLKATVLQVVQPLSFVTCYLHSEGTVMMKAAGSSKNWYPSIKLHGVFPEC